MVDLDINYIYSCNHMVGMGRSFLVTIMEEHINLFV